MFAVSNAKPSNELFSFLWLHVQTLIEVTPVLSFCVQEAVLKFQNYFPCSSSFLLEGKIVLRADNSNWKCFCLFVTCPPLNTINCRQKFYDEWIGCFSTSWIKCASHFPFSTRKFSLSIVLEVRSLSFHVQNLFLKKQLKKCFQDDLGWIISTASSFTLHPPWSSLSHIPDLNLISLGELKSLPCVVWLWARQAEFSVPGTVIVVKSCLMDRRLFCCLQFFFQQMSWKCAGAHFGAQRVDSSGAVVPERAPCPWHWWEPRRIKSTFISKNILKKP